MYKLIQKNIEMDLKGVEMDTKCVEIGLEDTKDV